MGIVTHTGKPAALNLPAPQKKLYIYKKRVMTLVTLMTTPESPVVIGFACHHIQIFT